MKKIVALIVGLALMAPSAALAQGGSTCQSYNPQLCSVSSNTKDRTTATTASASTLPFTGLDVVLLAAGGGALLGAGLLVRRLSRDFD
ncbi:MAG: hypothetical protein ACRDNK_03075 [Solirubrobacteraceae bacterium]